MSTWAIIPVKPLNRAKSRLATVLSPDERYRLAESMLRHVLETVQDAPQVIGTLVISRDSKALSIAREYDARTVMETGAPELNAALTRATQVVAGWGGESVLVLPADLPLVTTTDLSNIITLGRQMPSIVLAPDQLEDGTNALFMHPPGLIAYAYGPGSYERHRQLAAEAGLEAKIYQSDQLALDVDISSDLDEYQQIAREAEAGQNRVGTFTPD